jgi:hypothetical protein
MSVAFQEVDPTRSAPMPARPNLVVSPTPDSDAVQLALERRFVHDVVVGVLIGIAICAPLWAGLVFIAIVGNGQPLAPALWMAAGIGAFAGMFFGLFGGAVYGNRALERHEHASRRPVPESGS